MNKEEPVNVLYLDFQEAFDKVPHQRAFENKKEVVLGLLKSIKVDKPSGSNGIYPRLFRGAREEIAGVLSKTFVSSRATGEVPGD
eukprot:g33806.t1